MTKILSGKTLYLIVGIGTVILGLLIGFFYGNITDTEIQQSNITISSGTSNSINQETLPLLVDQAANNNWERFVLCIAGRGEYLANADKPYLLNYSSAGELSSIYFISTVEQPEPWKYAEDLTPNEMNLVDYEHWNFIIHFQDPLNFCKSGERDRAAASGYEGQGYKSTPTPFMSPTPTPPPSSTIDNVISSLNESNSIIFNTISIDPAGISVISDTEAKSKSESLPTSLMNIIKNLQGIEYGSNSWINNVSHKSITGTVDSSLLKLLIPNSLSDKTGSVTIWLTDDDSLKRMQIKGILTETDTEDSTRTFDIE